MVSCDLRFGWRIQLAICGYADAAFEGNRMDDACHTASSEQGVREGAGSGAGI